MYRSMCFLFPWQNVCVRCVEMKIHFKCYPKISKTKQKYQQFVLLISCRNYSVQKHSKFVYIFEGKFQVVYTSIYFMILSMCLCCSPAPLSSQSSRMTYSISSAEIAHKQNDVVKASMCLFVAVNKTYCDYTLSDWQLAYF